MSRNKACAALIAAVLALGVPALATEDLIAPERIVADVVKYNTATVEKGSFSRSMGAGVSEYYPLTTAVTYEGDTAVYDAVFYRRGQEVKKGDPIMRVHVEYDKVAMEEKALSLERTKRAYEDDKTARKEEMDALQRSLAAERDSVNREILSLRIKKSRLQAEQAAASYEYSIAQAEKEIAELEARHSVTEITSPVDGVVADITFLREGSRIYNGQYICTIASQDVMFLAASDARLRYGMDVTIETGNNRERVTYPGRVVAASDCLRNVDSTLALIQVDVPEGEKVNWRNPKVNADYIYVGNVLIVNRRGITMEGGHYIVTRLTEDGVTQKRYVNQGLFTPNEAWILQGLNEGDVIIID